MPSSTPSIQSLFTESLRQFRKDDGFTLAAALSFYAILSLIPLTMILVSIFGHFVGDSESTLKNIMNLVSETIPYLSPTFLENLSSLIQRKVSGGWLGVGVLFLLASVLFSNLEKVLDKIFAATRKRNYFHSKLLSVAFIFLIALLFFVPTMMKNLDHFFSLISIPLHVEHVAEGGVFFFIVAWMSFLIVLALVPHHQVEWSLNAIGASVFAVLLIGARFIFRWYTSFSMDRFHLVYGSLTSITLIILWVFYLMNLFIFCAELVGVMQNHLQKK